MPAWDTVSYSQLLGPKEEAVEKRAKKCQCVTNTTMGDRVVCHAHTWHPAQSVRFSPQSPSLASDSRRLQSFHCHSQPNPSSQRPEKRSQVYSMSTYTFLQPAGFPPPPKPPCLPFPGRINWRVGRDSLQRTDARWGHPPDLGKNGIFLHLCETKPP